tara:strand:- start:5563 stop:8286 length:2724 start_codon:yes stop_codon:yes gene_type:complete
MRERTDYLGRDGYTWWIGEVENIKDPSELGRVQVRILGWYTGHKAKQAYTKEMPTKVLPWAQVLLPTDHAQTKGAGTTCGLQPGAWVMGFFLDGDEAQLPIVMGAFRGFQVKEDPKKKTTAADGSVAEELKTETPQKKDLAGNERNDGNPYPKVQTQTPTQPGSAGGEEARGVISAAEETLPGNSVTNPTKPPVEKQSIADGVAGAGGEGFQIDLERQLTELGNMAATLASGPSGFISLATGKKVAGDKVMEHMGKIMNFLAGGIAGILAPLKEMLAKLIAEVVGKIVQIVSSFVPLVVINTIMMFLEMIFDIFCMKKPMWLGLVQAAISDVSAFANNIATQIVDKIADKLKGVDSAVKGVTNRILSGITSTMNRVKDIAGDVIAAVDMAKGVAGAARSFGDAVTSIFEFDFTTLNWAGLIKLLFALLSMFFKKDCGRKIKRPRSKAWYPLIGTTECGNINEAIVGTPFSSFDDGVTGKGGGGSYIDKMFTGINTNLMEVVTQLNGAKTINDATPGIEKQITQGPGGVTDFQDAHGNTHKNVPNNETKIVAKDKCETIKGNYVLTVEGDFYLKVMGNYHEEVTGSKNDNASQGPQAKSKGSSKSPDTAQAKSDTGASNISGTSTDVTSSLNTGGADKSSTRNLDPDFGDTNNTASKYDNIIHIQQTERDQYFKALPGGHFYPVDEIPFHPEADAHGRVPWGSQLEGKLEDKKEQKSASRKEGDHDIAYTGDVSIQGAKVKITGINSLAFNAQTIKTEANTIENVASGEITNEANWISSFLNSGRFEIVAVFNPLKALSGQFTFVNGAIIDITTDLPIPGVAPPTQTRICLGTSMPGSMNDIIMGSTAGVHSTFIATPTGVIAEFVPTGALLNQVATGLIHTGVGTGYMATGCGLGPHQVYGLPLLLN